MEAVKNKMNENENCENEGEEDQDVALPGFRFHPTDEELIGFYLRRKVEKKPMSIELIKQIEIYKYDPWDLPSNVGDKEWYFFCIRGRKYRNSLRPNRVTGSGFWKATGIDKPIYSTKEPHSCIGLKKSLVYYRGSAGKGTKTDWMMHEFRLPLNPNASGSNSPNPNKFADENANIAQEAEVWTLCRIFKRMPSYKKYNNMIPPDHNNKNLETITPKKSSSISSLSTVPVGDSNSKTCSLETEYTGPFHANPELDSDHHRHPNFQQFSQRNKRSKPVDSDDHQVIQSIPDHDCETSSATNTTREGWFNLGQSYYSRNDSNVPQLAPPQHHRHQAPVMLPGSSCPELNLNPNSADHDFFTDGSWDELRSVVQLAVDRNPSQLYDIMDKLH